MIANWYMNEPASAVLFDCDSTLSQIEGIDELARHTGTFELVKSLTEQAMNQTGLTPQVYQDRLALVHPSWEQVQALGQHYYIHRVTDALEVIQLLQRLNKSVYILSAGLLPALKYFGELLHVPMENIFGVDIQFDHNGQYKDFDHNSPLITNEGKKVIVSSLKAKHPHMVYIGDGLNDCAVAPLVTRFIGFGGVCFRQHVADCCEYYMTAPTLAGMLPLTLCEQERALLNVQEESLFQKGLNALESGAIMMP